MPDPKPIEIFEVQEWIRTAPLKDVHELVFWAQGVLDIRASLAATGKKQRSDAGKPRGKKTEQPTLELREPGQ